MLRHEFLHQNASHLPHRARPFLDTIVFVEGDPQGLAEDVFLLYEQARAGAYAPQSVYAERATPVEDAVVQEVFAAVTEPVVFVAPRPRARRSAFPWQHLGGKAGTLAILAGAPIIAALLLWLTDLPALPTSAAVAFAAGLLILGRAMDAYYELRLGARLRATGRFAVTTAIIFGTLFVSLNYSAYWERLQYFLRAGSTNAATQEQQLLETLLAEPSAAPAPLTAAAPNPPAPQASKSPEEVDLQANLVARHEALSFDDFAVAPPDDRLIIPKLGKNVPIVHTNDAALVAQQWEELEATIQTDLERGVVHYPGTANPGERGNVFITGHSSYYAWSAGNYKSVFALLDQLVAGDQVIIYSKGEKYVYVATTVEVVPPTRTDILSQPKDASIMTLMTCTPVGTAKDRLVIRFNQVSPDPAFNREPTSNDGTRIRSLQA